MAKKKDLSSLVGAFTGQTAETTAPTSTTETQEQTSTDLAPDVVEALKITPDMEQRLNALRKEKVGRPKGTGHRTPTTETRATFVVNPEQVRKLKYISLAEGRLHKDVISEALSDYISKWESKNGIINLPKLADR